MRDSGASLFFLDNAPDSKPGDAPMNVLLRQVTTATVLLLAATTSSIAAPAAACRNTGNFAAWLDQFKKEALTQGISQQAIATASPHMLLDQKIIHIDRGQKVFGQPFLEFSDRMAAAYRIKGGQDKIRQHAAMFQRAEQQYGVPPAVIAAFWALESDFGASQGKYQVIPSVTTLAYDCRRSEMFRKHLFDMLRLVQRGDLAPSEMIGSWAGELGQTQMMPTEYFSYAVDYDGDGRRDLIHSAADVIGSTANYIQHLGWKRGEPWLTEVRVPANLQWDQADLKIKHPRSQWAAWGVTMPNGSPLPNDALPASLLLPMGRFGPAFLAYANFDVYLTWNNSLIYSTTAAYLATRIAGAPAMYRGAKPIPSLPGEQAKELQLILIRMGYDVGGADGKIGIATRAAVKQVQMKFGMPADSYPTAELLVRLRAAR
jgi:lytic murein transglycosylase